MERVFPRDNPETLGERNVEVYLDVCHNPQGLT